MSKTQMNSFPLELNRRSTSAALIVALGLLFSAVTAPAQTLPNLSGIWTGQRTEKGGDAAVPENSDQILILNQTASGGPLVGTLSTNWPGTSYHWSALASGILSGNTLALTWTIIPASVSLPSGDTACSATPNLTLSTGGGVTTATVPTYHPCGGSATVEQYTLTLNSPGLIIPQVVDGGGWQTTIGVTNTNTTAATATLQFYQQTDTTGDTQPWTPPLAEAISTQNMQLAPGATIYLQTPDTASTLTQGFGELIAGAGVQAYAIFTLHVPGRQNQDGTALAAVPGTLILVPFDNSPGFTTTIAVVNASGSAETLSANLLLASGQVVPGSLPSIPALGHAAFALATQFPESAGQQGTLELSSSAGTFSVIGLRFNPTGAFTSLPVYVVSAAPF